MKFNISHEMRAMVTIPVDDKLVLDLIKNHMQKLMQDSGKYDMDFVKISVTPDYCDRGVTDFTIEASQSKYLQDEL
jgi:hypothetical protein